MPPLTSTSLSGSSIKSKSPVIFETELLSPQQHHQSNIRQVLQKRQQSRLLQRQNRDTKSAQHAIQLAKKVGEQAGRELAKRVRDPEMAALTVNNILNISENQFNQIGGQEFNQVLLAAIHVKKQQVRLTHEREMQKMRLQHERRGKRQSRKEKRQSRKYYGTVARRLASYGPNVASMGASGGIAYLATTHINGLSQGIIHGVGGIAGSAGNVISTLGQGIASTTSNLSVPGAAWVSSIISGGLESVGYGITSGAATTTSLIASSSSAAVIFAGLLLFVFLYFTLSALFKILSVQKISFLGILNIEFKKQRFSSQRQKYSRRPTHYLHLSPQSKRKIKRKRQNKRLQHKRRKSSSPRMLQHKSSSPKR